MRDLPRLSCDWQCTNANEYRPQDDTLWNRVSMRFAYSLDNGIMAVTLVIALTVIAAVGMLHGYN